MLWGTAALAKAISSLEKLHSVCVYGGGGYHCITLNRRGDQWACMCEVRYVSAVVRPLPSNEYYFIRNFSSLWVIEKYLLTSYDIKRSFQFYLIPYPFLLKQQNRSKGMHLNDISLLVFITLRPKNNFRKLKYFHGFENLKKIITGI